MSLIICGIDLPAYGGKIITIYPDGSVLYDGSYVKAIQLDHESRLIDANKLMIYKMEEEAVAELAEDPTSEYLDGVKDGLHLAAKNLSCATTVFDDEQHH